MAEVEGNGAGVAEEAPKEAAEEPETKPLVKEEKERDSKADVKKSHKSDRKSHKSHKGDRERHRSRSKDRKKSSRKRSRSRSRSKSKRKSRSRSRSPKKEKKELPKLVYKFWDKHPVGYEHLTALEFKALQAQGQIPVGSLQGRVPVVGANITCQSRRLYVGNIPFGCTEVPSPSFLPCLSCE